MLPKIETILYCTEMGRNTPFIFRYAYAVAKQFGARIVALHVFETLSARQKAFVEGYAGTGSLAPLLQEAEAEAVKSLPKRIEAFFARESPDENWHEIVTEIVVAEGHATEQILGHVESTGADLVVVGAHGHSPLFERLLGSTTRRLIRECPVPVLTVQVPEEKQVPNLMSR